MRIARFILGGRIRLYIIYQMVRDKATQPLEMPVIIPKGDIDKPRDDL